MTTATATLSDPKQLIADAIGSVTAIATLPEVTMRIIKTVEDPKSSAAQLHKLISHDPALVTKILKVVNSSFYGLPGQIASIERAIVLLGLNAVKNLAVAASLGALFRGVKICEGFTARDLWTHCIAVGTAARQLAREMKLPIADEAFLAGMIHDAGLLVELQMWPDLLRKTCEKAKTGEYDFTQLERDHMGVDHQMLGAALAEKWKFPRSCQLVCGHHHQPTTLSDANRLLVTIVYIADTLCAQGGNGFNLTAIYQKIEAARPDELKLDIALIEHTRAHLPEMLEASKGIF